MSLLAFVVALAASLAHAAAPADVVEYGLFGKLHLTRPSGAIAHTVLLLSDRDGWSARTDRQAAALAQAGAFVVGIDLPTYLLRMESIKDKCSYPSGHVEEVAHWIERHEGFQNYSYPLLAGDGSGATFAYAVVAQAPAGTFAGLLTLGGDLAFSLPKPLCAGDAGAMTKADAHGNFRVVPVAMLPASWSAAPFASAPHAPSLVAARTLASAFAPALGDRALADAYLRWRRRDAAGHVALPEDVADLPLIEIAPTAAEVPRIAIILTGDGGWAGLDRGIADVLSTAGVRTIGFSTLKFFWHTRQPQEAADAIARVIAHYGAQHADARFSIIGYSFGASLVPVVINRLPEQARARVDAGVMISPDPEAVFEIKVGDWFGSAEHEGTVPLGPEIAKSAVPLVCVQGGEEKDSYCATIKAPRLSVLTLPGGHHFDGDYRALGESILHALPASAPAK